MDINSRNKSIDSNHEEKGYLRFKVTTGVNLLPILEAHITVTAIDSPDMIRALDTDISGISETIELPAPPKAYSSEPTDEQPYAEYNVRIVREGFKEHVISGVQIFSGETGIQHVSLVSTDDATDDILNFAPDDKNNPTVIDAHTLWEYYPPKIAEEAIKPLHETGEIVLSKVVVPQTIVVHDGVPTDKTATNYYVSYADYIKNVACCEIYSTWPDEAITANVLAIMSFTLNRVYTEWYRNKGYNFTITSSTAFDHKWTYGKTIYENISRIVDNLFASYIAYPNVKQPILTQYCDGKKTNCPGWLSQWGSKALADDGLSAVEILRYYYNSNLYIAKAEAVSGIPSSYPGYDLTIGSSGAPVITIQEQINAIAKNYPAIQPIVVDGIFGANTKTAVATFQSIFDLPASGIVDYPTWYKLSEIYVAVSKLA